MLAHLEQPTDEDIAAFRSALTRLNSEAAPDRLAAVGSVVRQWAKVRHPLSDARQQAGRIAADLRLLPCAAKVDVAGSCRRCTATVGDLDIVAASGDSSSVMDALANHHLVESTLLRGTTKMRVRLYSGIELDMRVVPDRSYGAALQYFTGPAEHNVALRSLAKRRGLKLNEYGLFDGDDAIAGHTEESVYEMLGLDWIPPHKRTKHL